MTSTARNVVVTTARATTKAARVTGAGSTRTTLEWSSFGGEGAQQSDIKPASTARNVVVTTARVTMKAARVTVAGATRTTVTTVATAAMVATVATATTVATMTPNGD